MNKLQFLNILANAPKNLKNYPELLDYARNVYKQIRGVFPEGIDNISIKQAADEVSKNRKKVIKFPEGGKDKTDFFSTRPDPRVKQPPGAKMDIQRANENLAGGANYAEGDTKYNADILGTELARVRGFIKEGQDSTDMDPKEYSKLYDEAYSYLTGLRFLNRPPKKEGVKSIDLAKELEELTNKNLKDRGLGNIKLGDKLPPPKNKKPDVDPVLQKSEDQKQLFMDFEDRNKTRPGKINYDKMGEFLGVKLRGDETFDELLEIEKNLGKPKKADGGRIGFSGGGAGFAGNQMEGDQPSGQMDMPRNTGFQPIFPMPQTNIPGSGGMSEFRKFLGSVGAPELGMGYNFPVGESGILGVGVAPSGNVGMQFKMPLSGGRFGLKEGGPPNPGRRNFMKIMAGLASLPVVGKLFKGAKVADKVVQLKNTTTKMPAWFPNFVDRFMNKGIGKKIDADLTEYTVKELPDVKLLKQDNGAIRVEGKNAYNEEYYIDYEPPGVEVIDYNTGKTVKTKGDFVATDTEYRMISPEDYDVDGVNVDEIDDILGGSSTKLEGFAKGTNKEKYTTGQKIIDEADARGASKDESLRADINNPYGDVDPTDFAKGGLAYMLGE